MSSVEMDALETLKNLTVAVIPIVIAITFHEAAHGLAADKLGDPTPRQLGRLTLNPAAHIDPFGTVIMPIILFVLSNGSFIFGSAKPVPINIGNLRHPKRDSAIVAAAGPLSNVLLAFLSILLIKLLPHTLVSYLFESKVLYPIGRMLNYSIYINIFLAAFNLIPIPPLDGGRVLVSLLPLRLAYSYGRIEPFGMLIVLALWATGLAGFIIGPIQLFLKVLLRVLLVPFGGA